jgi:tRNA dimethylallyltransferase
MAMEAIAAEHRRRGVAFLVGGSGLYLRALLQGMRPPAVPPQPWLRHQFQMLGQPLCHELLQRVDPVAAERIAAPDTVRTQRALEVFYATGRPMSAQQGRQSPPWRVLELALDPPDLDQRIIERTHAMYEQGLIEETAALICRHGTTCPLLETIGYGEARRVLGGELDRPAAMALTVRRTRQYAKRQRTWFRNQHRPLHLGGTDLLQKALQAARSRLG